MKIVFSPQPGVTLEIMADRETEAFQKLSRLQQVFGEKTCGLCDSTNIRFNARKARSQDNKEFTYHEMICLDCEAKLAFGENNNGQGTLFPKRTNDKSRGWAKYQTVAKNPMPLPPRKQPQRQIEPPPQEQWEPQDMNDVPF